MSIGLAALERWVSPGYHAAYLPRQKDGGLSLARTLDVNAVADMNPSRIFCQPLVPREGAKMPYKSRAERERPLWMSLTEAVRYVEVAEGSEQTEALIQIRMALGDGDIPVHWAADPLPQLIYPVGFPPLFSSDQVPTDAMYWDQVLIFLDGDGRVIDQSVLGEEKSPPRPRQLLLLRSRVFELWPLQDRKSDDSDGTRINASRLPIARTSKKQIREAAKEVYQTQVGKKPPNSYEAEKMIREKVEGATRKKIRAVLDENEFKVLRLKRGDRFQL
jgi:hypothetical protein